MDDIKVKQNVLQQIMKLMGEMEGESLKSKSPKFMKIQMGTIEPKEKIDEEVDDKSSIDNIMKESKEKNENEDEIDDEMIRKLEEMLKK